ncbi:MAG: hypothetical protein Q9221_007542 [Calogaya cf. arnoldii]
MPPTTRAKRRLAETDGNFDIAPNAKRPSPPRSANVESKENEDPGVNPTNNTGSTKPGPKVHVWGIRRDFPEHAWIMTLEGWKLFRIWKLEQHLRDPECYRADITIPIFRKWSGCGVCEVIENMFLAFGKHIKTPHVDIKEVWSLIESMAFFLNSDVEAWYPINDNEGNGKRVMLIGTTLLTAVDLLKDRNLFKSQGSPIRNLGLILALFIEFAHTLREQCRLNEDGWVIPVIKAAESCSIGIQSPENIEVTLETIQQSISKDDNTVQQGGKPPKSRADIKKSKENMTKSYAPKPTSKYGGVITMDFFNEGTKREWDQWDWATEVSANPHTLLSPQNLTLTLSKLKAYTKEQAVKVGAYGPQYNTRIGSKFYDLTARGNRGKHSDTFVGPPGSYPTEDSEDDVPPEDLVYCPSGKPVVLARAGGGADGGPRGWCGDKCEATCGTVPNEWVRSMTAKRKAKLAER